MTDKTQLEEFAAYLLSEDRSPVTVRGYVQDVGLFARWYTEKNRQAFAPKNLANQTVRQYRQQLLEEAAKPQTVNRRLASLAAYWHWARQAKLVDGDLNPVQGVKGVPQVPLAPRWLTCAQQAAFLRAVDDEVATAVRRYPRLKLLHLRDATIARLLLNTGLRLSELQALRMNDVQLSERKGTLTVRYGKGQKRRTIPLNAEARRSLTSYLNVRPEVESDYLFLGQRNREVKTRTIQRAVERFAKVAKLEGVTPHVLRHSFAKGLIDRGVTLEKVAMLLGHSSLNTTRIYTIPGERDLVEAVDKLSSG